MLRHVTSSPDEVRGARRRRQDGREEADPHFGSGPGTVATAIVRPGPPRCSWRSAARAGAAALRRELRIEHARKIGAIDAGAVVGNGDATRSGVRCVSDHPGDCPHPAPARRAGLGNWRRPVDLAPTA